jgi:menaquinone-dependent protoporphyrinogen oxidase
MSLLQLLEWSAEGILRITIGAGLVWIGAVERGGYGLFLGLVGGIFIVAGVAEIWSAETAAHRRSRRTVVHGRSPALVTCDIPVFYATTHGQTRRIAERLVALFHEKRFTSRAVDLDGPDADDVDWSAVQAAVVIASLHVHKYQRSAASFCHEYVTHLNVRPSVFVSVSLAAASEDERDRRSAARLAQEFVDTAGWKVDEVVGLAGRLAYTQYGLLTRLIMKRIARQHGHPADTTRDYELTNWDEVGRVAAEVVQRIAVARGRSVA